MIFDGGSLSMDSLEILFIIQNPLKKSSRFMTLMKKYSKMLSLYLPMNPAKRTFLGLRDYVHKTGFHKGLVGLSGELTLRSLPL